MNRNATKPISKQALYSMVSSRAKKIIKRLLELSESQNESVALGACKILLNKILPDIHTVEMSQAEPVTTATESDTAASLETDAQKAERLILAAQALMGRGRYAPRNIQAEPFE